MKISSKINVMMVLALIVLVAIGIGINSYYMAKRQQDRFDQISNYHLQMTKQDAPEIISNILLEQNGAIELYLERINERDGLSDVTILSESELGRDQRYEACTLSRDGAAECIVSTGDTGVQYYRLEYGSKVYGFLRKVYEVDSGGLFQRKEVLRVLIILGGLVVVVMVGLSLSLDSAVAKPLRKICKSLQPLKYGKFDIEIPEQHTDEMTYLVYNIRSVVRELDKYQDRIKKSARLAAIGQSTSMIAHDIRKPFASMKSLLEVLPEKKDDPAFVNYATSQVRDSIRKADSMMSDILEYSKDAVVGKSDVGVQGMITSALGDVFKSSDSVNVNVNYDFKHSRQINVDEVKVARVFTNIIGNAIDALKGSGQISIETMDTTDGVENWVEVEIVNDGPKISDETLKHLFEPFYTKGKKGGTGLGLAICQKIVSAHGGNIEVKSTDEITAFIIRLPAGSGVERISEAELIRHSREIRDLMPVEPAKRSLSEDVSVFLNLHKKRGNESYLLIVDDEPLFRETIRSLINRIPEVRDNIKVVEADSAEVALKQFEARQFDYVISDIDMGRMTMDGYEFVRHVLDHYPKTMTLIHSNKRIHGKDEELIGREHFQGFLPKPMDEEELVHFLAGKEFEQAGGKVVKKEPQKRVLVINDESVMRIGMRHSLQKIGGVQVVEASGMTDALKVMAEQEVDVVLSDINLDDDGSGYEILEKVRGEGRQVKFYMMSGMTKEDEWPKAKELGADGYIQVPYEDADLKCVLSDIS